MISLGVAPTFTMRRQMARTARLLALLIFSAGCAASGEAEGAAYAKAYKAQTAQFAAEFDAAGRTLARALASADWDSARDSIDAAISAVDQLRGWMRGTAPPKAPSAVAEKLACEMSGLSELRLALGSLRSASEKGDAPRFALADKSLKNALQTIDGCSGSEGGWAMIGLPSPRPTASPRDPERDDLVWFARLYSGKRDLDDEMRMRVGQRYLTPSPFDVAIEMTRLRDRCVAWAGTASTSESFYALMERTPTTRGLIDEAVRIVRLRAEADEACAAKWVALQSNRSADATALSAKESDLRRRVDIAWIALDDHIDDALRAKGLAWRDLGGRP